MTPILNDPAVDEVREVRRRISDAVGNDPAALVAYYLERQKQYTDRLVGVSKAPESPDQSAA